MKGQGMKGMTQNRLHGFTIVELMVVLAIVSILAVVALPAYVNYSTRAQVAEGVGIASGAKTAVMDAYLSTDAFPVTNAEAGLGVPTDYARQWVTGLTIGAVPSAGTITMEINISQLGTNNLLQLVPSTNGASFEWVCQAAAVNGIENHFLPSSCR